MSQVIIPGQSGYTRLASAQPTSPSSSTQSQRQWSFQSRAKSLTGHPRSAGYNVDHDNTGKKLAQ